MDRQLNKTGKSNALEIPEKLNNILKLYDKLQKDAYPVKLIKNNRKQITFIP